MKNYPAILASLYDVDHCILASKLLEIESFLLHGGNPLQYRAENDEDQINPSNKAAGYCVDMGGDMVALDKVASAPSRSQFVAVLPLFGTMYQHGGMSMEASGGTSTEQFGQQFKKLAGNSAVKSIVIEVHSPGGQVIGTQETSDLIHKEASSGRTRVVAAVNSMAASAALWTSTAANEVHVTPGGLMGSIGVVRIHQNVAGAEEKQGLKTTLMAIPEAKIEGNPYGDLGEQTVEKWKGDIGKIYERFVSAVARNRGVSTEKVISDFGGGEMLTATESVDAGLADSVATKDDVISGEVLRLRAGSTSGNRNRAALAEMSLEKI